MWSSSVELPIQHLLLGIYADPGLTVFGGDETGTYLHSPDPNYTYLVVDSAYVE